MHRVVERVSAIESLEMYSIIAHNGISYKNLVHFHIGWGNYEQGRYPSFDPLAFLEVWMDG